MLNITSIGCWALYNLLIHCYSRKKKINYSWSVGLFHPTWLVVEDIEQFVQRRKVLIRMRMHIQFYKLLCLRLSLAKRSRLLCTSKRVQTRSVEDLLVVIKRSVFNVFQMDNYVYKRQHCYWKSSVKCLCTGEGGILNWFIITFFCSQLIM